MRALAGCLLFVTALTFQNERGRAQTQTSAGLTAPTFEVTSVKQNTSTTSASRLAPPTNGRFTTTNVPLRFVALYAYRLMDDQLIGMPEWTSSIGFDISATYARDAAAGEDDVRLMVRGLLADRFGFVARQETRELPVYSLVLVRRDGALGPQLVRSHVDCDKWRAENPSTTGVDRNGARPECAMAVSRRGSLMARTATIQQLTASLQSLVGRRVVDQTGLSGAFNMDLQWTSDDRAAPAGTNPTPGDGASLFTALSEQLGLRLVSGRAPVNVLVVQSVKRPEPD